VGNQFTSEEEDDKEGDDDEWEIDED